MQIGIDYYGEREKREGERKNEAVSGRIIPNRSWTFASNILHGNIGKPSFQIVY